MKKYLIIAIAIGSLLNISCENMSIRKECMLGLSCVNKKDYTRAAYWFHKAAKQGDSVAEFIIGDDYFYGHGLSKNYIKARFWFKKSATQNYALAQYRLGELYDNGMGIPKNYAKAMYWYNKAAAKGLFSGQIRMAYFQMYGHANGYNVTHYPNLSYTLRRKFYLKAAELGDAWAESGLSDNYQMNRIREAFWLRKSLKEGAFISVTGDYILSRDYYLGQGMLKNYVKAVYWDRLAAMNGMPVASCQMGKFYYYGQGVVKNYNKALYWYKKANSQMRNGYYACSTAMGLLYEYGDGVPQNYSKAVEWYLRAFASPTAEYNLGVHYMQGTGVPMNYSKAMYYFNAAAEFGLPDAAIELGRVYRHGWLGVARNNIVALKWEILAKAMINASNKMEYHTLNKMIISTERKMTISQTSTAQTEATAWYAMNSYWLTHK